MNFFPFISQKSILMISDIVENILIHRKKKMFSALGIPNLKLHQNHLEYFINSLILGRHLQSPNLESENGVKKSLFLPRPLDLYLLSDLGTFELHFEN